MYFERSRYNPLVFLDYFVTSASLAIFGRSASILVHPSPAYEVCKFDSGVGGFMIAQHTVANKFSFCSVPTYVILLHPTFTFRREAREWIQMAPAKSFNDAASRLDVPVYLETNTPD